MLAGGWCVLFFSLSGCKLPTYILPALPLLALVVGAYVAASRTSVRAMTVILVVGAENDRRVLFFRGLDNRAGDVVRSAVRVHLHDRVAVCAGVSDQCCGIDQRQG